MKPYNHLRLFLEEVRDKVELLFHDEYSIAAFFRRKGARIGKDCRILIHEFGSEPFLVSIGDHCTIAPGVAFITHDASVGLFRAEIPDLHVFGKIDIKENCFIGLRATILYNVTIGPNAIVGTGSVVTRDVPPNTVVAGVPARVVSTLDDYKKKCLARWKEMGLPHDRSVWEQRLIAHFWPEEKEAR